MSAVQPVAILSAWFCFVCRRVICVVDIVGRFIVPPYCSIGLVLYAFSMVSLLLTQCVEVRVFSIFIVLSALAVMCFICSL